MCRISIEINFMVSGENARVGGRSRTMSQSSYSSLADMGETDMLILQVRMLASHC